MLLAGFTLAWGAVGAYLLHLHLQQRRLREELAELRDRLDHQGPQGET